MDCHKSGQLCHTDAELLHCGWQDGLVKVGMVDCHESGQLCDAESQVWSAVCHWCWTVILWLTRWPGQGGDGWLSWVWSALWCWISSLVSWLTLKLTCYIIMADRMAWSRLEWLAVMSLISCVMLNHKFGQLFDTDAELFTLLWLTGWPGQGGNGWLSWAWSAVWCWITSLFSCLTLMLICYIIMADRMAWSRWGWLTITSLASCVMLNHKSVQLFDTDAELFTLLWLIGWPGQGGNGWLSWAWSTV